MYFVLVFIQKDIANGESLAGKQLGIHLKDRKRVLTV